MVSHFTYNNIRKTETEDTNDVDGAWRADRACFDLDHDPAGRSLKAQRAPFDRRATHRGLYGESVGAGELRRRFAARPGRLRRGARRAAHQGQGRGGVPRRQSSRACGMDARVIPDVRQAGTALFGTTPHPAVWARSTRSTACRSSSSSRPAATGNTLRAAGASQRQRRRSSGFHPLLVRWYYRHAPKILRRQLSRRTGIRRARRRGILLMSRLLTNARSRPQFIAYRIGPKCLSARLCEASARCGSAGQRRGRSCRAHAKTTPIFEHYRPAPRG